LILNELLTARKKAKKLMNTATDPMVKSVMNGRQLALKISANSVYGFTGAQVGQMPCLQISSSVTAFGRQMIDQTKSLVEGKYNIANGYEFDADVVYGDTDSVFVKFGCESVAESMRLGEEAAAHVSETFIQPIKLEFEKVYCPFLLMAKKRYVGLYWTKPEKYDKVDAKGMETVRRDNCGLVRMVCDEVVRLMLIENSQERAMNYVKGVVADLLQNKIDLSLLVISKSMSKAAADYDAKQAHVELAERMRKRDPSTAPAIGDRVPYVMIQKPKGTKGYEKSEDPLYVLENQLAIDADHYIDHQLREPLKRLFVPIYGEKAERELFAGEHTLKRAGAGTTAIKSGVMSKFLVKGEKCLSCKAVIPNSTKGKKSGEASAALCKHCQQAGKTAGVVMTVQQELHDKQEEYGRLWSQCQRCMGNMHQDVICSSRDCPLFYRRTQVKYTMTELEKKMDRLRVDW